MPPPNSLLPLQKDTGHSCVFEFPDRALRPTPPPGPPADYPYEPAQDWDPTNPLDNGVPGSANPQPPPSVLTGTNMVLYWSVANLGFAYNAGVRNHKGDGVSLNAGAGASIDSTSYVDPYVGGGGSVSDSSIGLGIQTNGNFHGFLWFQKMIALHPTVLVFTGDIGPAVNGQFLGGPGTAVFTETLKEYHGAIPPAIIGELGPGGGGVHDFSFTGFPAPTTFIFTRSVPSTADVTHPFFHFSYVVATSTLTLTYP